MRKTTKEMLAVTALLGSIYLIMLASGIDLRWLLYFIGLAIWLPMVLTKLHYKIFPHTAEELEYYRNQLTDSGKK